MTSFHPYHESIDEHSGASEARRGALCYLCEVSRGAPDTPYSVLFPGQPATDQIIASDPRGAFVMIDVAPVAAGHCLVVPNRHRFSIAQLEVQESVAVRNLASQALTAVRDGWGVQPVLFEHGACAGVSDPDSCGIDHAHLHVVANETSAPLDEVCGIPLVQLDPVGGVEALRLQAGVDGYIYVESADGRAFGSTAPGFPSQALRRHFLAPTANDRSIMWNWSDQVVFASALDTAERVRDNLATLERSWPRDIGEFVRPRDPETRGRTR